LGTCTAGISGNGTGIKRRIHMITRFKKNSLVWTLIALIIFSSVGLVCLTNSSKNKNPDESKKTVQDVLTALYTVTQDDIEYYQKMVNGAKPEELKNWNDLYENTTAKFKTYLSDNSYQTFYAERLSYLRIKNAYENNYYTKIKSMKIDKIKEDKQNKTITYHYDIEISQINLETNKKDIVNKTNTLTVTEQNGTWKILDGIKIPI
jgi:hypothetical protein